MSHQRRIPLRALIYLIVLFASSLVFSKEPDWSENYLVPTGGRENPYDIPEAELSVVRGRGQLHAQIYPVDITGIVLPERPIKKILENQTLNPVRSILNWVFKEAAGVQDFESMFRWVGLVNYPRSTDPQEFQIAMPEDKTPDYLLGYSRIVRFGVTSFTMSCAACHSDQLFGQTILGMSKRFPRANQFFIKGNQAAKFYDPLAFHIYSGASRDEVTILTASLENLKSVGLRKPLVLGLDISLAQVGLSLGRRAANEWADKDEYFQSHPRLDEFDQLPGDSKPAVWWNLKYKNRWLSDGSVVSGNPIYTNILWNEIGRGTDLRNLQLWLKSNQHIVTELTTMVFSTQSPRIETFFPAEKISKEAALRGEKIYQQSCEKCHGEYLKNWNLPEYVNKPWSEQIKTYKVKYSSNTRVKDVGTDPNRYLAMKGLEKLNLLRISKEYGINIRTQKGYVPPPLVGIWARWPYLHNNSVANLCELLTPAKNRVSYYYSGPAISNELDFDFDCNGYPLGQKVPKAWKSREFLFDTKLPGLSNLGHDENIFIKDNMDILSPQQKHDLIKFLQTL